MMHRDLHRKNAKGCTESSLPFFSFPSHRASNRIRRNLHIRVSSEFSNLLFSHSSRFQCWLRKMAGSAAACMPESTTVKLFWSPRLFPDVVVGAKSVSDGSIG